MKITQEVVVIVLISLLVPSLTFGQAQTTGRVSGFVVDEDGTPITGARVTFISSALQGERVTETDADGGFVAALLPVGPYAISVASPGKETVQVSLRLGVGQTVPLLITMQPGEEMVESVTVHAAATPLETTIVGENFNYDTTVEELPIADRNILDVSSYAPNISVPKVSLGVLFGTATTLAISGAPSWGTIVQLDGVEISDPYFGQALALYLEDAVEDIQVMTTGIPARYGRFDGGVINGITKTGGNEFDGTIRAQLSKEGWNSKTPFGEQQSDDLNQTYQATLGGFILKDRLWFFAGARAVPTRTVSGTTVVTGESYQGRSDDQRWQLNLRGAVNSNHVVEMGYLNREFEANGGGVGRTYGDLLAANSAYVEEPMSLLTLGYRGIIGAASFFEFRASSKQHSTRCCNAGAPRTIFIEPLVDGEILYNTDGGNYADEWKRNAGSASFAFTRVLGNTASGRHTIETGVQYLRSTTAGSPTSPTTFRLFAFPFDGTPFAAVDPQTREIRYNLGAGIRIEDIPVNQLEGTVDNLAIYAQDSWQWRRWRFDLGLRWDRYDVSTYHPDLEASVDALAPRIGVTRDISRRWQIQGTWGRYVAKFYDALLSQTAGIRNASAVLRAYTGDARTDLSADELEDVLRDDSQWGLVTAIWDPEQPTAFLAEDIELPYADEITLGVRAGLPRGSGSFTATFIDRTYENLLDGFVGGYGDQLVVDPFTGEPPIDPSTGETILIDNTIWNNASVADRRYQAIAATWDHRPGARWGIGGNWTYSELKGNQEADLELSSTAIGTYERSRPEEEAVPDGFLRDDVRNRIQAWGDYRFDLKRAGALVLGGVGRYQSGRNWNRAALVPFADDPEYNNEVGQQYVHYFDGRGNNNFDDWWTVDLSARWQVQIYKRLDVWLKTTVVNVFNNDALISYDTTGFAVDDGDGNLTWEPSPNFGQVRSQSDYQIPRSYVFTLGLEF